MKRMISCLAALVLLLLSAVSFAECEHRVRPSDWILQGYIGPQPGVPGYSGDFCCPICGAVMKQGQSISALDPEDSEGREEKANPEPEPAPISVGAEAPAAPAETEQVAVAPAAGEPVRSPDMGADDRTVSTYAAGLPRGYTVEDNTAENKTAYPYIVHTASATWFLSKDDIDLMGEDAFFEGFREILQYQDADFVDARAALAGYIWEEAEPIEIRTDFCGKAGITEVEMIGAYYNPHSNFIKVFRNWEIVKATLLHEYVHYLTLHCTDTPVAHGLFAEGIAEYISAIVCKNRMRRDYSRSWSEENKNYFRTRGTWDTEEDCLNLQLYESDVAGGYAHGVALGTDYLTTMDIPAVRTPEIQQNPTAENISHEEAASILAYLVETYSRETVFSHLNMDPAALEQVYGKAFADIYKDWMEWNAKYFNESGVILRN